MGEEEGGDDGEVVAEGDGDDLRVKYAPHWLGYGTCRLCCEAFRLGCGDFRLVKGLLQGRTGEDVVDFLGGFGGAEGGFCTGAVGPLGGEHADGGVVWGSVEVAGKYGGVRRVLEVAQYELGLCHAAQAVERLEVGACHDDGVAVGEHEGALEQSALLHLGVGVGQLDVVHIHKLVAREQPYAIVTTAELDGGAEQSLHAAVVGEFGNKVAAVLMLAVGAMRVLVHFLQRHEVGVVLLDEQTYLLQAGVVAGMQVECHHRDGVGVA